jgi:hypothetical protein
VGICYETGFAGDVTVVDWVYASVVSLLREQLGWAMSASSPEPDNSIRDVYEMYDARCLTPEVHMPAVGPLLHRALAR